ncbi:hypothetical protein V1517DRAFT_267426 [Lipomyces orientalis]|uniref:Uncharacterized protein n=1 Tax=Lipomyces orientalis TaxID=1233043 RepID=A0ACC3TCQ4_9ASCO
MHLILEGIIPRTFHLWVSEAKEKKRSPESARSRAGDPAKSAVDDLAGLGADIKNCAHDVPAALARSPEDVYLHYRSYRAHNWFDFLQLFVHPLLVGRAPIEVRTNLALLAQIYSVATQEQIPRTELQFLERAVHRFVLSYEHIYTDPTICTSNLHGILHLGDCVKNCGPAWAYWQFTMEKTCGNVVSWLRGSKLKDENLANAILLNEQVNLLRWIHPDVCLSWEDTFLQQSTYSTTTGLTDQVKHPPAFTAEQLHVLLAYIDIEPQSAIGNEVRNQLQQEAVRFRKYHANSEDIVTSSIDGSGQHSRCRQYVRCLNNKNERYFGEVDLLLSFSWESRNEDLALVRVFQNVLYSETDDELFGRVQGLRNRETYLACIPVTEIECTIGIFANSFTGMEYILDRNWIDYGCKTTFDVNLQKLALNG